VAIVERERGEDLYVERPHAERTPGGIAHERKRFGATRAQRGLWPSAKRLRARRDLAVGKCLDARTESIDLGQGRAIAPEIEADRRALKMRETLTPPDVVSYTGVRTMGFLHDSLLEPPTRR